MGINGSVISMMIIPRMAPSVTIVVRMIPPPTGTIMPSPVTPAIVAVTIVWSIPSIPRVVPGIVPSVAIIPIPRINKNNSMITT